MYAEKCKCSCNKSKIDQELNNNNNLDNCHISYLIETIIAFIL